MAQRALDPRLQALYDEGVNIYSFSKLSAIRQCLYQVYLTYVRHQRGTSSIYGLAGSCVHDVLQAIIEGNATTHDLLPALRKELEEAETLGLDFPPDRNGGQSIKDKWLKDMQHFCLTFYPPKGKFQCEQLLILKISEKRAIQGYIDLLRFNDDGTVSVLDWKSSSNYSQKDLLEHGRQLTIYGMALEQAGYTVKSTAWIMLKYVVIRFSWFATRRSKTKSDLVRIVNRSKIYDTIKDAVEAACREAGMDENEIEFAMMDFAKTNILGDSFPDEVKAKFIIKPYVRTYPYTPELKAEALDYINNTANLYESMLQNTETPWEPCEIDKTNSFFCGQLCSHRKTCPYIKDYNERTMAGATQSKKDEEDLF